ncbi:MAG: hypothetical protein WC250_03825 [Candidatus Paceibacterota bacterium]|jgi:hypothetical protein
MNENPKGASVELDYSETAARRAALSDTIQHPLTLWPPALGVAAGFGLGLFGMVTVPAALGIAAGCTFVGAANWAIKFFGGRDACLQRYYAELHDRFEVMKEQKLETVATDLKKLGCNQGREQVGQLADKFENLRTVLSRVLNEGELSFTRFLGSAEVVYASAVSNLERVANILTNISDINRGDISRKLDLLKRKLIRTSADERTVKTLEERAKLYDDSQAEVAELLARNEEVLTAIDQAGSAALKIKGQGNGELEGAMSELVGLINRVNNRSKVNPLDLPVEKQT